MLKKGVNVSAMQMILIFLIVLATVTLTSSSLGKSAIEGARDFNIPIPGTYCPGDVGEVPYDEYINNIKMATKVAWNGKKACWLRQQLKPATPPEVNDPIYWEDILDEVSTAMTGKIGFTGDDCLASGEPTLPSDASIDLVFWWDDKQACSSGLLSGPVGWVGEKAGESRDTLYLYPRKDYCNGEGDYIDWYNPARWSNIDKYSRSKGRFNDANICIDETDSGGDDLSLPYVWDLTGLNYANAKTQIIDDIKLCIQNYEEFFMGGFGTLMSHGDNEYDKSENYMACPHTYLFQPTTQDYKLIDIFNPTDFSSAHMGGYKEYTTNALRSGFHYALGTGASMPTIESCDTLDPVNPSTFNSVTWHRDSKGWSCMYYIKDRFVKSNDNLVNAPTDADKLLKDNIYKITAFYYFEKDESTGAHGYNDIIFVIDEQK